MNESMDGSICSFRTIKLYYYIIFFLPSPLGGWPRWLHMHICVFLGFVTRMPNLWLITSVLLSFLLGGRCWTKIRRYPTNGGYSNTQEAWQTFPPYTPSLTTLGVLFWCTHHVPIVRWTIKLTTLRLFLFPFLPFVTLVPLPPPPLPSFLPTPLSGHFIRY